jgi:1-acyl-sn-glycerol-3-phosphate acyltransferase
MRAPVTEVKENKRKQFKYPSQLVFEPIRIFCRTVSRIFWKIEFLGLENIPINLAGGLLIAPNHQTYFDPFWLAIPVRRNFRFMAWDRAFEWFFLGRMIRYLGAFPVNLERGGIDAFKQAVRSLREGATLVIFPEGGREFSDGRLLPFKNGAARIAMQAGVPILPVTIKGGERVWARDMKYPRAGRVQLIYHPLLEVVKPATRDEENAEIDRLTTELERVIQEGAASG